MGKLLNYRKKVVWNYRNYTSLDTEAFFPNFSLSNTCTWNESGLAYPAARECCKVPYVCFLFTYLIVETKLFTLVILCAGVCGSRVAFIVSVSIESTACSVGAADKKCGLWWARQRCPNTGSKHWASVWQPRGGKDGQKEFLFMPSSSA